MILYAKSLFRFRDASGLIPQNSARCHYKRRLYLIFYRNYPDRITSYNVCYTKLLRVREVGDGSLEGVKYGVEIDGMRRAPLGVVHVAQ